MIGLKSLREQAPYIGLVDEELIELLDYVASLEKENKALKDELMFACEFDAYTTVDKDRYDLAIEFMNESGRNEPSFEDEVNGLRKLIQMAMEHSKHEA